MVRKLTTLSIVAIAGFYLIVSPLAAGNFVKHAGTSLGHAGHQIAKFLEALG